MVALNLLAASLLVAGVGSSLGLPSPMNVSVSSAVGYGSSNLNEFSLISPVLADVELDADAGVSSVSVVSNLNSNAVSISGGSYLLHYSSSALSYEIIEYTEFQDHYAVYLGLAGSSWYVSLPDLSLWEYVDSEYLLCVYFADSGSLDGPCGYYGYCDDASEDVFNFAPVLPADLGSDMNPVTAITDGLTAIAPLGGAFTNGFDAVFMDDGALTAVGMFAFILMGVGISVGITKKCFNWVTGRHGM